MCLHLGEPWKMRKETWEPSTIGIKPINLLAEKAVERLHSRVLEGRKIVQEIKGQSMASGRVTKTRKSLQVG